jgi:hypothetical protein
VIGERRGEVELVGLSSGQILWPIGKRSGQKAFVLCGALADAVRKESVPVVACWWESKARRMVSRVNHIDEAMWWPAGGSLKPDGNYRALGVPATNKGTFALRAHVMLGEHVIRYGESCLVGHCVLQSAKHGAGDFDMSSIGTVAHI